MTKNAFVLRRGGSSSHVHTQRLCVNGRAVAGASIVEVLRLGHGGIAG